MKFKAVIFDLFGTLIDNFSTEEHKAVLSSMASVLGAESHSFIQSWFNTFQMRSLGTFKSVEENIIHVCKELNIRPKDKEIEKAAEIRFGYTKMSMVPKIGAVETLSTIRKLGYKTALISDCSTETPRVWDETPFSTLFDVTIFSCLVGIKKPDIQIYKLACDGLYVSSRHCLYIGDGSSNELSGARSAGMFPIQIQDPREADAHRIDEEPWEGERISQIPEVLKMLGYHHK
jgi:putative hydrolase of the HAD superfamily